MYQFTTHTIINSNLDSSGATKVSATSDKLTVLRTGDYLKSNIVSINKTPYIASVLEQATITAPSGTAGDVCRLVVKIKLTGSKESDYATTYTDFFKPIIVEVLYGATATDTATALKNAINKIKDRFGYSYLTATSSGAVITFTAKNEFQRFETIQILTEYASNNTMVAPEYTVSATGSVTVEGKTGFGNYTWMISNISIPTLDKTRHFGLLQDERPIVDGQYSQYTIRYSIDKDGGDGIVAAGKSITTHVFYVESGVVSAFENALTTLGTAFKITLAVADDTLANSATTTSTVTNAIGAVTYSVTSGTSATVDASTGVVTADATIDGATVIRATDAVGNYAEVTVTVA